MNNVSAKKLSVATVGKDPSDLRRNGFHLFFNWISSFQLNKNLLKRCSTHKNLHIVERMENLCTVCKEFIFYLLENIIRIFETHLSAIIASFELAT